MNKNIYNLSVLVGILSTSLGVGFIYIPAGLIAFGLLVLLFTVYAVRIKTRGDA